MQSSIELFVESLESSGVLSLDETQAFIQRLPNKQRPNDADSLAAELVREGMITHYQAQQLIAGNVSELEFGKYQVLNSLGAGGMGKVFKVRHRTMRRVDAIKVLPRAFLNSPDAINRFHQEVRVAARLDHPNIVRTFDANDKDGVYFLVMEYVDGRNVGQVVEDLGSLPVEQCVEITVQVARALQYAHEQGVIHRDVKPSNLMLDQQGVVKLMDMGLASLEEKIGPTDATGVARITRLGQLMGTYAFMAPEQATDASQVDARADIYSLGCTLYAMLIGHPPYKGETPIHTMLAHRQQAIPSLHEHDEQIPRELDLVFRKMVAKQPVERYEAMQDVIAALETYGEARPRANAPNVEASLVHRFDKQSVISLSRLVLFTVVLAAGVLAIISLILFANDGLDALERWRSPPVKEKEPSGLRKSTASLNTRGQKQGGLHAANNVNESKRDAISPVVVRLRPSPPQADRDPARKALASTAQIPCV